MVQGVRINSVRRSDLADSFVFSLVCFVEGMSEPVNPGEEK